MVRDDDSFYLWGERGGELGVLVRLDAFEHDWQCRVLCEPRQCHLPRQVRSRPLEQFRSYSAGFGLFGPRSFGSVGGALVLDSLRSLIMLPLAGHRRI